MNRITKLILNINYTNFLFLLLFYGFPFAISIKIVNNFLLIIPGSNFIFSIIAFLIVSCCVLIVFIKKNNNKFSTSLCLPFLLVFFYFFFNSSNTINYKMMMEFLICILILFSMSLKNINFNLDKIEIYIKKITPYFIYFVFFLIVYKFLKELNLYKVNKHILLNHHYFGNIFLIYISYYIFNYKILIKNKIIIINLILILFISLVLQLNTLFILGILLIVLTVASLFIKKKISFSRDYILFGILIAVPFLLLMLNLINFFELKEYLANHHPYLYHSYFSINARFELFNYYLHNFNFKNIFLIDWSTLKSNGNYPHSLLLDLLYFSGLLGLISFFIFLKKYLYKNPILKNNTFFSIIFSNIVFASLSGIFFTNYTLLFTLCILCKYKLIK